MAGFIKLVMFVFILVVLLGAYVHYSTGPIHSRFDPKLQDLLSVFGEWIPGLSPHSN